MSGIDIKSVTESLVLTSRENDSSRGTFEVRFTGVMEGEPGEWIYERGVTERSFNMINTDDDRRLDPVSLSVEQGLDEQKPQVEKGVQGIWVRPHDNQRILPLSDRED
jgi:hypothetical protein